MRKALILFFIYIFSTVTANANIQIYKDGKYFGLKDNNTVIAEPIYKKIITLDEKCYIVQKNNKFGLINTNGEILIPIKYTQVERMLGKYLKIGSDSKVGLYDSSGKELLPIEYSKIDLLFGGMFLTCKDYKYGIIKETGEIVLENKFDEIYMPKPSLILVCYNGVWYEIEHKKGKELVLPEHLTQIEEYEDFIIKEIFETPSVGLKYSAVTTADYLLKLVSSISPAHEKTIDELMLHKGIDTLSIFAKMTWIPKYPFIYMKNYYKTVKTPNNGPLSDIKYSLKQKI